MVLDEHLLALCNQRLSRARVQVQVDAVLLVLQARFGLFHVLGHAVAGEELLRLGLVVRLGRLDERRLERRPVHFEVLPVRVGFVQAERDCSDGRLLARAPVTAGQTQRGGELTERVDHFLDQVGLDRFAVPLLLDQLEDGRRELVATAALQQRVEVLLPRDERELANKTTKPLESVDLFAPASCSNTKTHDVDDVDVFASLVLFALDPVAVEVGEEPVDVGSAGRVAVPLAGVVAEEGFVGQVGRLLKKREGAARVSCARLVGGHTLGEGDGVPRGLA